MHNQITFSVQQDKMFAKTFIWLVVGIVVAAAAIAIALVIEVSFIRSVAI